MLILLISGDTIVTNSWLNQIRLLLPIYNDMVVTHTWQSKYLVCTSAKTLPTSTSEDTTIIRIRNIRHAVSLTKGLWYTQYPFFYFLENKKEICSCLAMRRGADSVAIYFWDAVRWGDLINKMRQCACGPLKRLAFLRFSTVFATDDLLLLEHKSIYF